MSTETNSLTCTDCGLLNCYRRAGAFPKFCLTETAAPALVEECNEIYRGTGLEARIAHSAAAVEGTYHGSLTRVEEIIAFARRLGAAKIGVATCIGLMEEAKVFVKVLEANDLEPYSVICKVGSVDKTAIGIPEELKLQKGSYEAICNPILQARLLNLQKTDLNVIVGLCVGHDSLFIRHSRAPVTTLITKDRVLCHNPAAALYNIGFFYKKLLARGRNL